MARRDWEIDHLDPRWEEGRDYQLVCGLDCIRNLDEKDHSFNVAKSNRFLPWRWSREEIGVVPQEFGDLCLFLDPDTEDWVLEDYLGEWWFQKSARFSGRAIAGKSTVKQLTRTLAQWVKDNPDKLRIRQQKVVSKLNAWKERNPENFKESSSKGGRKGGVKSAQILHAKRVQCTVTGYISTPAGLSNYQKARGIDPSNRRQVELKDEG
jgi:hypothetical protein